MEVISDNNINYMSENSNNDYKKAPVDLKEEFIMNNNRKVKIRNVIAYLFKIVNEVQLLCEFVLFLLPLLQKN